MKELQEWIDETARILEQFLFNLRDQTSAGYNVLNPNEDNADIDGKKKHKRFRQ